ncbi:hypothetical protein ACCAA_1170021 [Candidatus Accumulibacter aalborgensis]|uniref:Uncharacterized protein n=1 Tax=Candidatus Accumulibacter aalborgensis TaxID=1860102 RepID=A0A1A8XIV5_9PROT|nr:hypothetical protein ACCAA_1170021 [Candidatus Accumulibacter aalborgensis]
MAGLDLGNAESTTWELANVQRLPKPVPYQHRSGQVTWVTLDDAAAAEVASLLSPCHKAWFKHRRSGRLKELPQAHGKAQSHRMDWASLV